MRLYTLGLLVLATAAHGNLFAGSFYKTSLPDGTVSYSDVRPGSNRRQYKALTVEPNLSKAKISCFKADSQAMADRISEIDPIVAKYAAENNVNRHLVRAIIRVESCFDKNAVSSAGAEGLMQLMPGTAKQFAVSDAFDIEQNIRAGVQYFAELQDQFNSDLKLSLAAYNAGPGAVNKHGGIPPYPETQKYVVTVMDKYREYALAKVTAKTGTPQKSR